MEIHLLLGQHSAFGVGKSSKKRVRSVKSQGKVDNSQTLRQAPKDHDFKERKAVALIKEGKFQDAELIYRALIADGTRNYIVYSNLAAICGMQNRFEENTDLLKKALEINPDYAQAHFNLGVVHKRSGDLDAAIASYKKALLLNPSYPVAFFNLGVALQEKGDLPAAIDAYSKTLDLKPNYPEVHLSLGNAYKLQGDLNAAIDSYHKALVLKPDYPEIHFNLGVSLQEKGELEAALISYKKAIEVNPESLKALNNIGIVFRELGDLNSAIASYKKVLDFQPDNPTAHNNLANALRESGDLDAAIVSFNRALEFSPDYSEAYYNKGLAQKEQGDFHAAIASFNKALALNSSYPEAHYSLGNAFYELGDLAAAIDSYGKAIKLQFVYPDAHYNLGVAFQQQGDLDAAIDSYNNALELDSSYPEAHYNLGNVFNELGDLSTALESYNKALELKPDYPDAHWNSSLTMLLGGDYKNGWRKYECRFEKTSEFSNLHALPKCRLWNGSKLETGAKILLVSEQGLGDTLQFMRYAIVLKEHGASVSICAQPKLHSLIKASGLDDSPLAPEEANTLSDGQWKPLLSVPRHLEVSPGNPLITEPYIKTTDELIAKWERILSAEQRPVVGINWQGNPNTETNWLRGRSLLLETFAPITTNSQIALLSLQKGFGSEQLVSCSFKDRFVRCQDQINDTWDFLETAAIIANCDLVITCDTSVAHLAGGMGKTTWLLLSKVPEWRWGLEGDTTFWYPSMRLFRQREKGNWDEVLDRVSKALERELPGFLTGRRVCRSAQSMHPEISSFSPQPLADIQAPISLGELIDKITILQIKTQHLQGASLQNVENELAALQGTLNSLDLQVDPSLTQRLKKVNAALWQIEDDIRDKERDQDFGEGFIQLARSVYRQNDHRAAIKKEINIAYNSCLVEEKSYQQY